MSTITTAIVRIHITHGFHHGSTLSSHAVNPSTYNRHRHEAQRVQEIQKRRYRPLRKGETVPKDVERDVRAEIIYAGSRFRSAW